MRNHNPVKRASTSPVAPKKAIAAMCASCMGCTKSHLEGGFKKDIRNCSSQHCPSHAQAQVPSRLTLGEAVNDKSYYGARA